MNPRIETLAFRIWRAASAEDWNLTVKELAERFGVSHQAVSNICRHRGWFSRMHGEPRRATSGKANIGGYCAGMLTPDGVSFAPHDGLPGRANERPDE